MLGPVDSSGAVESSHQLNGHTSWKTPPFGMGRAPVWKITPPWKVHTSWKFIAGWLFTPVEQFIHQLKVHTSWKFISSTLSSQQLKVHYQLKVHTSYTGYESITGDCRSDRKVFITCCLHWPDFAHPSPDTTTSRLISKFHHHPSDGDKK